jgi:hypothetical protein
MLLIAEREEKDEKELFSGFYKDQCVCRAAEECAKNG